MKLACSLENQKRKDLFFGGMTGSFGGFRLANLDPRRIQLEQKRRGPKRMEERPTRANTNNDSSYLSI
jgi:hypothetical protein